MAFLRLCSTMCSGITDTAPRCKKCILFMELIVGLFLLSSISSAQTGCAPTSGPGFVYDKVLGATSSCIAVPNVLIPTGASDPCAQISTAIGSLPLAQGGTIDARGFTATQLSTACASTLTIDRPITLLMPNGTMTFNGNPGIQITAPHVVIQCPASNAYQGGSAVLSSGAAGPLIAEFYDYTQHSGTLHGVDDLQVLNCDLNGNNIGTFGIFAPTSYTDRYHGLHVHLFTGAGIFGGSAQGDMQNVIVDFNGADGVVWGQDGHIYGLSQSNANTGDGWHFISGGNVLEGLTGYQNGLHGLHQDRNIAGNWTSSKQYTEPTLIQPTSNNSGSYAYYSQKVGMSSTTGPPAFCQTIGCVTTDGVGSTAVQWINIGQGNNYGTGIGTEFTNQGHIQLSNLNISTSNYRRLSGDWDDVLIEGIQDHDQVNVSLKGTTVAQSEMSAPQAHGVHLKYVSLGALDYVQWTGGADPLNPHVDLGGVELEHTSYISVTDLKCLQSYGDCLNLVSTSAADVTNLFSLNGGTSAAPSYALRIDSSSDRNIVESMYCEDSLPVPYQHQIFNSGTKTLVKNQRYLGIASPADGGSSYASEFYSPVTGNLFYNIPLGLGWNWTVDNSSAAMVLTKAALNIEQTPLQSVGVSYSSLPPSPSAGMQIFCTDCSVATTCSAASAVSCRCIGGTMGSSWAKYENYQNAGLFWYCQ